MNPLIPLHRPHLTGYEAAYLQQALAQGTGGGGALTRAAESRLRERLGGARVVLTSSCTSALMLAGLALGLGPGTELIVPSFAFASCASVFAALGAELVFADVRSDTLNLDETRLEPLIGPRTRAILALDYAGVGCAWPALQRLAAERGLALIEDAAHGLFGRLAGRALGTFGSLGTLSFDALKNVSCGEGGALILSDESLSEAVEVAFERGTNRARFVRGEVDSYLWLGAGGHFAPSELQAACLLGQLEGADAIQHRRAAIWQGYQQDLADWAAAREVQLPGEPADALPACHLYYLMLPHPELRQRLSAHLAERGIASAFHYQPLHASPGGRTLRSADCQVAARAGACLLRLPLYPGLGEREYERVVDAVCAFRG